MGFTPFKVAMGVEFIAMPRFPQRTPSSAKVAEWMDFERHMVYVVQSIRKSKGGPEQPSTGREPLKEFMVGDKVCLSTKYLNLKQPYKKLVPKYIDPFSILQIINSVLMEL